MLTQIRSSGCPTAEVRFRYNAEHDGEIYDWLYLKTDDYARMNDLVRRYSELGWEIGSHNDSMYVMIRPIAFVPELSI
jgi:DUF971 family protein